MKPILDWLKTNYAMLVSNLADLVAVPSISTDGEHQKEIDEAALLVCEQMRQAGLQNVAMLRCGNSNPFAYGEWLGAPGKPTVFLYSHYDVQPVNFVDQWQSEPFKLTARAGRLYGRGSADDKGGFMAQLGAVTAFLKSRGELPVNIKMVVEGEEEIGSTNLLPFFQEHADRIKSDVIVVCDTENIEIGIPSLTYSLRGVVAVQVDVQSAQVPAHSGGSGVLADAALALDVILSRLYWKNGKLPIPHYYDDVRPLTRNEKKAIRSLEFEEAKIRRKLGIPPGVQVTLEKNAHPYEESSGAGHP